MKEKRAHSLTLPDHIILEEILPRVPVKSLIRLKCVCKDFVLFMSTHKFTESCHRLLSLSSSQQGMLYFLFRKEKYHKSISSSFINRDRCIQDRMFNLDYVHERLFKDENVEKVVASSNVLVCLRFFDDDQGFFCLWNPTTRQQRYVTNPSDGALLRSEIKGFAYVPSIDDYKIFAVFESQQTRQLSVYLFSLRAGEWKRISCPFEMQRVVTDRKLYATEPIVIDNSRMYWGIKGSVRRLHSIVGFDFATEQFKEIPGMKWFDEYYSLVLGETKGYLSLHCWKNSYSKCCGVWRLIDPFSSCNTWEKTDLEIQQITPDMEALLEESEHIRKFGSRIFEEHKLLTDTTRELTDTTEEVLHSYDSVVGQQIDYVENLVSPFGTAKFENKEENKIKHEGEQLEPITDISQ